MNYKEFFRNTVILLGSTMSVMAGASIAPALPEMTDYFSEVENAEILVKIMLTIPSLFIALFSPVAGIILDKYGRRLPLLLSTILYGIAGTSGFYLDNLYLILLGRAILGVSVAFIMSGYITVIGDLFKGNQLNKFMGLQAAFMSFGGVVFLSISGLLADISWNYPFLIYLFAFIIFIPLYLFLYETKQDLNTIERKKLFVAGVFKDVIYIYAIAFFSMAVFLIIPVQLPFLLKNNSEISNTNIGLLMSLWIFCSALTSIFYKKVKSQFSFINIFIIAFIIWGIGHLILAYGDNFWEISIALILAGIGNGLALPNNKVLLIDSIDFEYRGRAVGILTMSFYFGQFFSPILFTLIMYKSSLTYGFIVSSFLLFVISILLIILKKRVKM